MHDAAIAAVKRAMALRGLTRADLARQTGMSRANVSHILNASDNRTSGNVTSATVDRMLGALGYEVASVTIRRRT